MKLTFGTDGWRGVIADEFTVANTRRVAQAHAQALKDAGGTTAAVAHDTRFLGDRFARAAAETLQGAGLDVTLLQGPTPTPTLSFAVKDARLAGGVMITASHNPPIYQGYKLKGAYGGSATPDLVSEVERRIDAPAIQSRPGILSEASIQDAYLHAISERIDLNAIDRAGTPLYHDAMHGAASGWMETFAARYLNVAFHGLRNTPSPLFGGVNPEPIEPNLAFTMDAMRDAPSAAFAVVTDGDADRVGAVLSGSRFFNSHQIFAVLLHHLAKQGKRGRVIRTVSTSGIIQRLADHHGLTVAQTPVGFKYITEAILEGNADPSKAVLIGGEESGGIGVQGWLPERDGIFNGLLLLETVAVSGQGLDEQFAEIEQLTGMRHHYDRVDLHLSGDLDRAGLNHATMEVTTLLNHPVTEVVTLDGVKLVFEGGFGMVRASGTEPVVRLYVEAPSPDEVQKILRQLEELARRFVH